MTRPGLVRPLSAPAPARWLAAILLAAVTLLAGLPSAAAEEAKPKTLLELLFQRKPAASAERTQPKPEAKPRGTAKRQGERRNTTRQGARLLEKPAAAAPAVEKRADARVVLVVGDFFAAGLAAGLTDAYAAAPGIAVVNGANGDSGIVRDDFHDWRTEIVPLIDAHKPAAVVMLVGANDRQAMRVGEAREPVRSPAWSAEYRRRVASVAEAVAARGVPLFWVGQLPLRSPAANADMLALNDIFRDAAGTSRTGGAYVDVWEGFVDETGAFMERGPDINGQTVALRSGQVNVTRAGFRKVAFYVERALSRLLSGAAAAPVTTAGFGNSILPPLVLGLPDVEANFARMRPVELLAPDAAEPEGLLGAEVRPAVRPVTPADLSPPPGRIDDFRLPDLRR